MKGVYIWRCFTVYRYLTCECAHAYLLRLVLASVPNLLPLYD